MVLDLNASDSHRSSDHNEVTADLKSPSSNGVPGLGMLIDRTSFDETDGYGVNPDAIQPWARSTVIDGGPLSQPPPVVLPNGKVRRRLRWRPKGQKKSTNQTNNIHNNNLQSTIRSLPTYRQRIASLKSMTSSNSSVVSSSNSSLLSKQSKKSLHSFASMETAAGSNMRKDKLKRMPLPRPNYPSTLDNLNQSRDSQSTIGTEGGIVHARMSTAKPTKSSPVARFEAADAELGDEIGIERIAGTVDNRNDDGQDDAETASLSSSQSTSHQPIHTMFGQSQIPKGQSRPLSPGAGLPPLFKNKTNKKSSRDSSSPTTPPRGDASVVSGLSIGSSEASDPNSPDGSVTTVPMLSGEEVEEDRRVDLRIMRNQVADGTGRSESILSSSQSHQLIDLLRSTDSKPVSPSTITSSVAETPEVNDQRNETTNQPTKNTNIFQLWPSALKSVFSGESFLLSNKSESLKSSSSSTVVPVTKSSTAVPEMSKENDATSTSPLVIPKQPTFYFDGNSNSHDNEIRFSMSSHGRVRPDNNVESSTPDTVPNPPSYASPESSDTNTTPNYNTPNYSKIYTGPVDCDDGAFLEAEKNLHAIHEMAIEHLRQGEHVEALEVFEEILRGQLARYGEDHYRVGTALHNIGVVHMKRGDYRKALVAYKEAVRVRKEALDPNHQDVAVSLAQLGVAYLETNKQQRAISVFREALKIRRKCYGNHHPKVAKILNNIGCALYELDELDVARVAFEEALEIHRNILRTSSGANEKDEDEMTLQSKDTFDWSSSTITETALLSIASTQCNIASIKLYSGEFDDAIFDLEEALLIQQCVLGDNHRLSRRTQESLLWLEDERETQQKDQNQNSVNLGDSFPHENTLRSTDDGSEGINRNSPEKNAKITNYSRYTSDKLPQPNRAKNSMFDSLERSFRRLHADLDYMSCGAGGRCDDEPNRQKIIASSLSSSCGAL